MCLSVCAYVNDGMSECVQPTREISKSYTVVHKLCHRQTNIMRKMFWIRSSGVIGC